MWPAVTARGATSPASPHHPNATTSGPNVVSMAAKVVASWQGSTASSVGATNGSSGTLPGASSLGRWRPQYSKLRRRDEATLAIASILE
jgi:hypothetical protein